MCSEGLYPWLTNGHGLDTAVEMWNGNCTFCSRDAHGVNLGLWDKTKGDLMPQLRTTIGHG